MELEKDECVVKTFHHHYFPLFLHALKVMVISFPFLFVASFFSGVFTVPEMAAIYGGIIIFFLLVVAHDVFVDHLDRLIVTNQRVLHIRWPSLFTREETEAEFKDIQDIETKENGILSGLKLFDYGTLSIQTASRTVSVIFENANDPEGIKHFIYHLQLKPATIRPTSFVAPLHDSTESSSQNHAEAATVVAGNQKR